MPFAIVTPSIAMNTLRIPSPVLVPVGRRSCFPIWNAAAVCLLLSIETALAQPSPTPAGAFAPGARELFSINFAQEPLGEFPKSIRQLKGSMEVVEKDGMRMLRASNESEFLITLPERLPDKFTLEFDLVTRAAGYNSYEIAFEGTPTTNRSPASAHVNWWQGGLTLFGGRDDTSSNLIATPDDIRAEIEGQPAEIRVEFAGDNFKYYINGRRVHALSNVKFVRARVLRVALGGVDARQYAVHLSRLRIADASTTMPATAQMQSGVMATNPSSPSHSSTSATAANSGPGLVNAITGINVTVNANGMATVTWNPLPVAATYFVVRWNAGDPACCNAMSPPGFPLTSPVWQDGVLPVRGTYAYRVIAKTANGTIEGETRFSYQGAATPPPGVASGPVALPAPISERITSYTPPLVSTTSPPSLVGGAATGTPTDGTIVTTPPLTAPYSSTPRTVSIYPAPTDASTATAPTGRAAAGVTGPGVIVSPEPPVSAPSTNAPAVTGSPTTVVATAMTPSPALASILPGAVTPVAGVLETNPQNTGVVARRYQVMLTGVTVQRPSIDDVLNIDGRGDEIFGAASVLVWDRKLSRLKSTSFVQTQDYGDVGVSTPLPNRIQAGSISTKGGLTTGDRAPYYYDPAGSEIPAPAADRFPLLVWEGELNPGGDLVIVTPSIWERDVVHVHFDGYKSNWRNVSPASLVNSATINHQLTIPSPSFVAVSLSPIALAAPPTPAFTGQPINGYKIADLAIGPNNDRPIGMRHTLGVLIYEERMTAIAYEKVSALRAGESATVAIPFHESPGIFLSAQYTLYLRVRCL